MSGGELPRSVLFACTHNAIRSPMAAELMRLRFGPLIHVDSAGVRASEAVSPLAAAIIDEVGGDIGRLKPKDFSWFAENEAGPFDLVITLSPEAHHNALALVPTLGAAVEYWPTFDPSLAEGPRDRVLEEYRLVRDGLDGRIAARFQRPSTG